MLSLSLVLLCLSSLPLFVWHCVVWVKINMLFIKVLKDDSFQILENSMIDQSFSNLSECF